MAKGGLQVCIFLIPGYLRHRLPHGRVLRPPSSSFSSFSFRAAEDTPLRHTQCVQQLRTATDVPSRHGSDYCAVAACQGAAMSPLDLRGTSICWTSWELAKVARVALLAAPPPRAPRGLILICERACSDAAGRKPGGGPPAVPEREGGFLHSKAAVDHALSHMRRTPFRWTSQELTKVSTIAQLAAPLRAPRGPVWMCVGRHFCGPLSSSRKQR